MQAIQADAEGMNTAAEDAAILQDKQREAVQGLVEGLYDIKKWWAEYGGFITDFFAGIAWLLEGIVKSIETIAEAGGTVAGWIGKVTGWFDFGDTGSGRQWGEMASGHPGVQGGQYLVGETGPEMVTLPEGAGVKGLSQWEIDSAISSAKSLGATDADLAAMGLHSGGGGGNGNITLNLTLVDSEGKIVAKKEFTRLIDGYMEENLNFSYT
jgi:hypothetical protein